MRDESFAARLRSARREAGMSVLDLARATGISRAYLYELEDEERNAQPSAAIVVRLAAGLGVPIELLMSAAAALPIRALPVSLRDYLNRGEASPAAAGILELIAGRVTEDVSVEDWEFLDGALSRTVLGPKRRSRKDLQRLGETAG